MAFSNHSPHHNHSPHNIRYFSKSEAAIAKILNGTHSVESATHYSPSLCVIYRQNRQNNVQHFVCPYHWLKKNLAIYFSLTSVVSKIQHCVSLLAIKTKKVNGIEHPSKKPSSNRKWTSSIGEAWKDSSIMTVTKLFEIGHLHKNVEFNKFSMKQVWKQKEKSKSHVDVKAEYH